MKRSILRFGVLSLLVFAAGVSADPVSDAISKPGRMAEDLERDVRSRPDVTLPLLQLQPGDRVADIWAGGGYYSELLASIVGPEGEVLLVNNLAYSQFAGKALAERMDGRDMVSVILHTREADDLGLGQGVLDAAVIIMSYHDIFYAEPESGWNAIDSDDFLAQIYRALKPGGRFLIVDHQSKPWRGMEDAQHLHRIEQGYAVQDIEAAGFHLSGTSDALRNNSDDHIVNVFDKSIIGKTDRFILVFKK